jgi:hypothetical protein
MWVAGCLHVCEYVRLSVLVYVVCYNLRRLIKHRDLDLSPGTPVFRLLLCSEWELSGSVHSYS